MEDVLEVYQRQYADNEVLVCLDETSKQQVKETRRPRPAQPGAAGSYDYEYERNGVRLPAGAPPGLGAAEFSSRSGTMAH